MAGFSPSNATQSPPLRIVRTRRRVSTPSRLWTPSSILVLSQCLCLRHRSTDGTWSGGSNKEACSSYCQAGEGELGEKAAQVRHQTGQRARWRLTTAVKCQPTLLHMGCANGMACMPVEFTRLSSSHGWRSMLDPWRDDSDIIICI